MVSIYLFPNGTRHYINNKTIYLNNDHGIFEKEALFVKKLQPVELK